MKIPYIELKKQCKKYHYTYEDLSEKTGYTVRQISSIMNDHSTITPTFALRIEPLFNVPAIKWLDMQSRYILDIVRKEEEAKRLASIEQLAKDLLAKYGYKKQFAVVIEKMSTLIREISLGNRDNLLEEIADVEIALEVIKQFAVKNGNGDNLQKALKDKIYVTRKESL